MLTPRLARIALVTGVFAACLVTTGEARAQFANHSIGVETGAVIIANPGEFKVGSGGGLGLNATLYIENGFDVYFRAIVSLNNYNNVNVVGVLPAVGFRYLLSEDTIRPYLGLSIGYLAFFTPKDAAGNDTFNSRFAIAPMAGIEFFVADNFSLGLQAEYDLMAEIVPQFRAEHAAVVLARFNWYF
ncbi:MAG: acyloxyacyl hydrolase [Myxococcales bacterium]